MEKRQKITILQHNISNQ